MTWAIYRDLNFFNEDINWANIDFELANTNWVMLLTDVTTDEMYAIITLRYYRDGNIQWWIYTVKLILLKHQDSHHAATILKSEIFDKSNYKNKKYIVFIT